MFKKITARLVLDYFRFFARLQLKKNPEAKIIGITGSMGKTSTRLAIVHILKLRGVVKHSLHANSQSGISLNILGLAPTTYSAIDWLRLIIMAPFQLILNREHYDYYVVEMGIDGADSPQNMSYLLSIIRPDVGVVLNASLVHAQGFDHLVNDSSPVRRMAKLVGYIAKEKMQLLKHIRGNGVAIYNLDQKELVHESQGINARQITFGRSSAAALCIAADFSYRYQGVVYELKTEDIFPPEYSHTFAAAIAVCATLGVAPSFSVKALSDYHSPSGRMRLFAGLVGSTIIDSSYNASPATMHHALRLLKKLAGRGQKIAVVGDMRELGVSEKIAHKNLVDWLLLYSDEVILFGDLTGKYTLPVLLSKKFPVHHFQQMSELIIYLKSRLKPKAYVLVKGSQNTLFLERAVEAVLQDQNETSKLCRRGSYWDQRRAKTC